MIALLLCSIAAALYPPLPAQDGRVTLPAQEWPHAPGPRAITAYVFYPGGDLKNVHESTGLMLCLHNWGGTGAIGAPDPVQVANRYDVVAISVDYLQSGRWDAADGIPYDYGYLQALDALRALHYVFYSLDEAHRPFARGRIYAAGGSGGGNVALMSNKLAPRTFACIVDISGMAELSDDIAFGVPGGSELNAGYSRDAVSPTYLSCAAQELRFIGRPEHLRTMKHLGNRATVVVVHGATDSVCPTADVRKMVANMKRARIDAVPHFIFKRDIDGTAIKDTGHSIGDRTALLFRFADEYLSPDSASHRVRAGKTDFELRDEMVRYKTGTGAHVISYADGYPVGRLEEK
ncbi:MAG: DUF2920 family protein [Candidatus Hydrogenedentes bacterium]|nr:DUF2920 family protein [Candidatus Hydrogenedentota bacterium]